MLEEIQISFKKYAANQPVICFLEHVTGYSNINLIKNNIENI